MNRNQIAERAADPTVNPYAPPLAPAAPRGRRRARFSRLVWVYVALESLGLVADAAHLAGLTRGPFGVFVRVGGSAVGLAWLYSAWNRLPDRLRAFEGRSFSPTAVVLRHFIPLYGLFWLFRAQHFLCDALDAWLIEKEHAGGTPRQMATVACALVLVTSFVSAQRAPFALRLALALASAAAWTAYMFAIEQCFARAFRKLVAA
jgi:hypothetical protein